ncbi:MAG: cytochrome c oxidase subunit II [Flavobacteriales bacterium]
MKLLIILVIILAIIAIVQLTKVYDLTRSIRKTKEEEISPADNKMNANLMLWWMIIFFAGTLVLYAKYHEYLPDSASEHGVDVDWLMDVNLWMITIMFFIMNAMLFLTAWKFYYRKDRKARFFAHDNRLEMLWTGIPGVAMAFIIVFGLITWKKITGPASPNALQIELFSKQFDWTARYPGDDKAFGGSSFNLISRDNALGLITKEKIAAKLEELDKAIDDVRKQIADNEVLPVMPASYIETLEDKIFRLERHKQRILDLNESDLGSGLSDWTSGADDKVVKGEMHLPLGQEVEFIFRSQDVIHSAYMPHFRAQMNTVPGVPTRFKMVPTITTKEMRHKLGNDKFDYILLCNKVCGAAHFNMQMTVIVETPEEYAAWLATQKTFVAKEEPKKEEAPAATDTTGTATAMSNPDH